jgi:threonyl-tRNA synthetase
MLDVVFEAQSYSVDTPAKTGAELAKERHSGKQVFGMVVDGELRDLSWPLPQAGKVEFVTAEHPSVYDLIRHSCAHILAQAVKEMEPATQVTIGPVIENGFYYDFSRKERFKEDDLPKIEAKMKEIIKARFPIVRAEWPIAQAVEFFGKLGEAYKVELINDLVKSQGIKTVSVYTQGPFTDLCRGMHVPNTGYIPAFKLTHVAGAYWRGDEKNEMLTRIYGTAFVSKEALAAYLLQLEEAKKRDHRRLGTEQKLFSFHAEAPASPFFHPNGAFVYASIQDFMRKLNRAYGFKDVVTPLIMSQDLWKTSGHYDNYRENMYFTKVDERDFAVKPMNCPGHCLIYSHGHHSYRDLPVRFAEFGRVHRHERSGVTAGLFRVRSFVQDDAHIFCTAEQVEAEIVRVLEMISKVYGVFGFEYKVELSTRPDKRMGADEVWDRAEKALENALHTAKLPFKVNPGDGAFYGPKIDFHLKDSIGRTHQCGTIQLDFQMPARFKLEYSGSDNVAHTPVLIHRAIIGSLERFMGIYIEHVAGRFPFTLSPLQAVIMTVTEEAKPFAEELYASFKKLGYRVALDDSPDKLAGKIKRYQGDRPSYMIILGAREAADRVVSLRQGNEQRNNVQIPDLLAEFQAQDRLFEI